ncbi:MAG TPA: hypothetical protein VGJ57_07000 [Nitrospirales bacterium]|jgi:hypothetical protein
MTVNTRPGIAMVALLLCLGTPEMMRAADSGSRAGSVSSGQESSPASIKGQVLRIDPDTLVLGTDGGGQVRLKLDKDTKFERALKVGDKVEAELGPERQAVKVKLSEGASAPSEEPKGSDRK